MLFVVAARVEVGEMVAVPEPSVLLLTVTEGEPAPRFVSVPPLVDFSCTVQVAAPVCAAEGAVAPVLPPEVSP